MVVPVTISHVDTDEVLRYMGCPPEKADGQLRALVERCAGELLAVIRPRWAWREVSLSREDAGVRL